MKQKSINIKTIVIFSAILFFSIQTSLEPCTVAVVSGKVTKDGRPLLWKNRDASFVDNKLVSLSGKKYNFVGLVNAGDKDIVQIWAGCNAAGFAIINSASGDLAKDQMGMRDNGRIMMQALGECGDVSGFEKLLRTTSGKRLVGANFGVIDAKGNACFFETGATSFTKFDANNPRVAPQGYIIRTNYAYTSPIKNGGGGYIRFERASRLFQAAAGEKCLNVKFILQEAARDLVNEKLNSNPFQSAPSMDTSTPLYINTNDTINRNSTVSVALFQGAPSPKKPYLATMWIILGQPVCSVALPIWAYARGVPEVLGGDEMAPLNDLSRALVSYLYPDQRGHMNQYLNVNRLLQYKGEGFLKKLITIENHVVEQTEKKWSKWEKNQPTEKEVNDFTKKIADWAYQALKETFPDITISN